MLAKRVLQTPVEIQVGGRSVVNRDITQAVELRPVEERFLRLLEILGEWYERGKVLIFVASQEQCDGLFRDLLKVLLMGHSELIMSDTEPPLACFGAVSLTLVSMHLGLCCIAQQDRIADHMLSSDE